MLCLCSYDWRRYGDGKNKEEREKEEEDNGTAFMSSSSYHTMVVWKGEGVNHTRTSKDEVNHRPTRISRTTVKRRTRKHH